MNASDYFEHDADIGVIGRGPTMETAFESAARALFAIMAPAGSVRGARSVTVVFEESDPEIALVTWLNRLLATARLEGLVLGSFQLRRDSDCWRGSATGEPWRADIERGVEVKGATLTGLSVQETGDGWEARCVVDV